MAPASAAAPISRDHESGSPDVAPFTTVSPTDDGGRPHMPVGYSESIALIWSIADLLRGSYKAYDYGCVASTAAPPNATTKPEPDL